LVATAAEVPHAGLSGIPLFVEPFFAALPPKHRLARASVVREEDLVGDLLVLADARRCRSAPPQRETEIIAPAGVLAPPYVATTPLSPLPAESGTVTLNWYRPGLTTPA